MVGTTNLWGEAGKVDVNAKPKLRVALVGCGGISGTHINGWKRLSPTAQIVACADPIEDRRHQRGEEIGLPRESRFPYLKDILKSGIEIDAVDCCTNNSAHAPVSIEALNHDLHVLCEKPTTTKPQLVRKIMAARDKAKNRIFMTAQHMRFEQKSLKLKEFLGGGILGDIYYARAQFLRRRYLPARIGFIDKTISGGGPCIDIGVHILDLTLHFMGYPEPVSVTAITPQKMAKRKDIRGWWGEWDRGKITVEDFAAGFIRFKNGGALTLECSWLTNMREPELTKITLMGTEAGAEWPELTIHGESNGSVTDTALKFPQDNTGGHAKEIEVFADAILTGKPSPVPAEQSLNVIRILDGLYRSHAAGKEVKV
ncbi:MAG: Gfo/Idh/MocA family oxidoreductase [Phycisphaerae bacterium]|nr:Gfo/Idh/MocA family oxidoreductase [Phycisphaerae bacterium]